MLPFVFALKQHLHKNMDFPRVPERPAPCRGGGGWGHTHSDAEWGPLPLPEPCHAVCRLRKLPNGDMAAEVTPGAPGTS